MTADGGHPVTSVVILTRNGYPEIAECLTAVFCQETDWPYEVIAIDSGSTDGTLGVLRRYPARLVEIPPESFNHGGTRNLGAELAEGEFVVLLTQDAIPANSRWLSALVAALDEPGTAGAFSRQLPKADAHVLVKRSLSLWVAGSDQRRVKRMPPAQDYARMSPYEQYLLAAFDNVSSCVRKAVWQELPFSETPFGEDIDWAQRALLAGHTLVYEPASRVYHSHNRSARYEFKRTYLDHQNLYATFGLETVPTVGSVARHLFRGWGGYSAFVLGSRAPLKEKLHLLFGHIPFLVPAQVLGQYLGRHAAGFCSRWRWFRLLDRRWRQGV